MSTPLPDGVKICDRCREPIAELYEMCPHCGNATPILRLQPVSSVARPKPPVPKNMESSAVPMLATVYGIIIMIFAVLSLAGIGHQVYQFLQSEFLLEWQRNQAVQSAGFVTALVLIWFLCGLGLMRAKRLAVYGLLLLGALNIAGGIYWLYQDQTIIAAIIFGQIALLYLPPIIGAFVRWDAFS